MRSNPPQLVLMTSLKPQTAVLTTTPAYDPHKDMITVSKSRQPTYSFRSNGKNATQSSHLKAVQLHTPFPSSFKAVDEGTPTYNVVKDARTPTYDVVEDVNKRTPVYNTVEDANKRTPAYNAVEDTNDQLSNEGIQKLPENLEAA